jgi:4-hydroxybenzoate decarboxylase subunit C
MDTLDYTGPTINEGSKGIMLGVGPEIRELPREFLGNAPQGLNRSLFFAVDVLC